MSGVRCSITLHPAIDLVRSRLVRASLPLALPTVQDLRDIAANNPALWVG